MTNKKVNTEVEVTISKTWCNSIVFYLMYYTSHKYLLKFLLWLKPPMYNIYINGIYWKKIPFSTNHILPEKMELVLDDLEMFIYEQGFRESFLSTSQNQYFIHNKVDDIFLNLNKAEKTLTLYRRKPQAEPIFNIIIDEIKSLANLKALIEPYLTTQNQQIITNN